MDWLAIWDDISLLSFFFLSGKLSIPQRPGSVLVPVNIGMQFSLFFFNNNINYTFHEFPFYFIGIALVKYIPKYIPIDLQNGWFE